MQITFKYRAKDYAAQEKPIKQLQTALGCHPLLTKNYEADYPKNDNSEYVYHIKDLDVTLIVTYYPQHHQEPGSNPITTGKLLTQAHGKNASELEKKLKEIWKEFKSAD